MFCFLESGASGIWGMEKWCITFSGFNVDHVEQTDPINNRNKSMQELQCWAIRKWGTAPANEASSTRVTKQPTISTVIGVLKT